MGKREKARRLAAHKARKKANKPKGMGIVSATEQMAAGKIQEAAVSTGQYQWDNITNWDPWNPWSYAGLDDWAVREKRVIRPKIQVDIIED